MVKYANYLLSQEVYLKIRLLILSFINEAAVKKLLSEPRHQKTGFLHMRKKKTQISFAVTAKLISVFVFAIQIVHFLYNLNPKFQVSSHLLWLYSPVCVGPGRKPRRPVFSERGSSIKLQNIFSHKNMADNIWHNILTRGP